jgi:hypothetical protein
VQVGGYSYHPTDILPAHFLNPLSHHSRIQYGQISANLIRV